MKVLLFILSGMAALVAVGLYTGMHWPARAGVYLAISVALCLVCFVLGIWIRSKPKPNYLPDGARQREWGGAR